MDWLVRLCVDDFNFDAVRLCLRERWRQREEKQERCGSGCGAGFVLSQSYKVAGHAVVSISLLFFFKIWSLR